MSFKSSQELYMDPFYGLHYKEGASHLDGTPEELREIFHPHWGKFPPQHPLFGHMAGIAYVFLWFMSFIGNGLVIYIFLKTKSLRTPTNMFVVNLAISDLCMMTSMGVPVIFNQFVERYWAWGILGCKIYGCLGAIFGTCSIMTMVVIGYDRYNVIVKGFSGVKISAGKAAAIITLLWTYCIVVCCPPFIGWGGYAAEGLLLTCSYDYLTENWNIKSFFLYALIFNYIFPLLLISVFYAQIVKAVVSHEAALKAQAKKMNVESLRSGDQSGESAEMKIAKVAITNVMLWFIIWTPYAVITSIACFGNPMLVSPLVSQLPAFLGASHFDGIPEDLMEIFDPHWGKFPPQLGNGLVIYIFLKTASLRTPTNMFVVNLAVSDLCMMTTQGLPVGINMFIERYWIYGVLACKVYACLGAIFGTCSILTMVVIGYDRYNVIVKGFSGVRITGAKAAGIILFMWAYCVAVSAPPFIGWGGYAAEGLLLTCSYDYLKQDWNHKSFMLHAFIFNYLFPLFLISIFYAQIVKAVVSHEAALKAQAKKMNVESLRSGDQSGESAEIKIAKVAITNVLLWFCIWSPYAIVTMIGCFGNSMLVTPLVSQLPAFLAKTASAINPVIYAISHPKYREALAQNVPCLGIGDKPKEGGEDVSAVTKT
ncbi:compound eye opsin BCRH1 [Eurytemora carolleeae]|uniref:compound eye opsin BCRH1 n=1 Tax=Eurytemora carolleeae TaxID=1294199 RepID=UPI000C787665|nr:compound eye opsin BCRH1 [Eurytemora carolleeae]|eukprot:XP_023330327.1 compound eye opsin BCRH1-like [Eurytemora affinis]